MPEMYRVEPFDIRDETRRGFLIACSRVFQVLEQNCDGWWLAMQMERKGCCRENKDMVGAIRHTLDLLSMRQRELEWVNKYAGVAAKNGLASTPPGYLKTILSSTSIDLTLLALLTVVCDERNNADTQHPLFWARSNRRAQ